MKLPFLTTLLVFIGILTFQLKRSSKQEQSLNDAFWEKERKANFTRKKNIDNLPYIPFDVSKIPSHPELKDDRINDYMSDLSSISGKKILNCTGISNTDLKLKYGAPNITKLTEYDGNYTILVRSLARIADKYLSHAEESKDSLSKEALKQLKLDAQTILEYGVFVGSDVRLNYELLGQIYRDQDQIEKIMDLIEKASELNSLSKKPILRFLEGLLS